VGRHVAGAAEVIKPGKRKAGNQGSCGGAGSRRLGTTRQKWGRNLSGIQMSGETRQRLRPSTKRRNGSRHAGRSYVRHNQSYQCTTPRQAQKSGVARQGRRGRRGGKVVMGGASCCCSFSKRAPLQGGVGCVGHGKRARHACSGTGRHGRLGNGAEWVICSRQSRPFRL